MPRLAPLLTCLLGLLLLAPPALAASVPPWGKGESRGEDLVISLVTFGQGDDVPSWWGHGSLVVEDQRLQKTRLYNYGMFSFDEKMLARFAMGRLEFWVADASAMGTFRTYQHYDRDVRVQELNLTPEQRLKVAKLLADNVLPENRDYLYHHYKDNCSTRLRDAIDAAVGGQLRQVDSAPARMTLREHTRRYTSVNAPMSVLLDFMQNDEIDQPITRWDEAFLPDELERQVAALQVTRPDGTVVPLVARSWKFYEATRPPVPEEPPHFGPWVLAVGLALGASALGLGWWGRNGRKAPRVLLGLQNVVVGLVFGLPGTALFIMWLVTDHTVTWRNENLFLANPLTLLAVPFGIQLMWGSVKARARLRKVWVVLTASGVLGVLLKVLPMFDQDTWRLVGLILPTSAGFAGAFLLERLLARASASATGSGDRQALTSLNTP